MPDGTKFRHLSVELSAYGTRTHTTAAAEADLGKHLFHEAHHVLLMIDGDRVLLGLPPSTNLFSAFQQDRIRAGKVGPEQAALRQTMGAIFLLGDSTNPKNLAHKLDTLVDFLIEERFSGQRTGRAFGQPESNAKIANAYVKEVVSRLPGHNHPGAVQLVNSMPALITKFYDAMDKVK